MIRIAVILFSSVYYKEEILMKQKKLIETQLDCRATASLSSEIAEDLSKPDKPMNELLSETKDDTKDESESDNKPDTRD